MLDTWTNGISHIRFSIISLCFIAILVLKIFSCLDLNLSRPGQNGRHFGDDIFKRIFLIEYTQISKQISLKYVPWRLIDNISALVQIMAWHRPGFWSFKLIYVLPVRTHFNKILSKVEENEKFESAIGAMRNKMFRDHSVNICTYEYLHIYTTCSCQE